MAHHYQVPILESMLTSLASLFRYSLRKAAVVIHSREELDHVQHYFNVMDMRSPQRYELRVEVSSEALHHPLLSMVLQPMVENSITHGFRREKEGQCILLIRGSVNQEERYALPYDCEDSGVGIPSEKLQGLQSSAVSRKEKLSS